MRLGLHGLFSRASRALLSALGVAVGIAAIIAITGISTSSRAQLQQELDSLGTNLLTAVADSSVDRTGMNEAQLPEGTVNRVRSVEGVLSASSTAILPEQSAYRSELIDKNVTGGIETMVADLALLDVTATELAKGKWLDSATSTLPTVVLGDKAAQRLGVVSVGSQILLGDQQVTVVGILKPSKLAPELDLAALVGEPYARSVFAFSGSPSTIYQRLDESTIDSVRQLIPATVNPRAPAEVKVSRPSDALVAKQAADQAFTGLLVALGGVALLVGGIGVANTMVISVLERRGEIGLRRALGATRVHVALQFLAEAVALSLLGAALGLVLGIAVVGIVCEINGWSPTVSVPGMGLALGTTILIGAAAGLYPAIKASRVVPSLALVA